MMTEQLRLFQYQDDSPGSGYMVRATEFRTTRGLHYTVAIIGEAGYNTIQFTDREDAIKCADNYIAQSVQQLALKYIV